MAAEPPLLVLFDGHALIHRAWHALIDSNLRVVRTGEPTQATYGFTSMLLTVLRDLKPTHAAVAFDAPGPTFRHQSYEAYKATRPPIPDDLRRQFQRVREVVDAFRIPTFELEGFEADDILGSLARQAEAAAVDTIIVTGDADTYQLIGPRTRVLTSRRNFSDTVIYDEATVRQRYGVAPAQVADLKGLMGDTSDNIPGVPGVGEKTAARLIQQFGSFEEIYAALEEVTPPRLRELLRQWEEQARQSKALATIDRATPVDLDLDRCHVRHFDRERVVALFRELEFRSLLERLPPAAGGDQASAQLSLLAEPASEDVGADVGATGRSPLHVGPQPGTYQVVRSAEELRGIVARLMARPAVAMDTETTGRDAIQAGLVGVSLCGQPGEAIYIPVGHRQAGGPQISLDELRTALRPLLDAFGRIGVGHNAKYDLTVLAQHGMPAGGVAFDTMIAAFLLNQRGLGLKELAFNRLGVEMTPITALIGTGRAQRTMADVPVEQAAPYAAADADMTLRLHEIFAPDIEEGFHRIFYEMEMPLVPVLMEMERWGIAVDTEFLGVLARRMGQQLGELELAIYNDVGHAFNINSTQQLARILYQELGLPHRGRTKTGFSTDAAVLETLRGGHPVVDHLLEYRQLQKLKSTYVDALPPLVNPATGRIHTCFHQTGAATGRVSSSDPNLQNIPVRTEEGRGIRRAFVARGDGQGTWHLVSADYSQIELRVLAHLSGDPALLDSFQRNEDIHTATAAAVYGIEPSQVASEHRRVAKMVNFGVIYGLSDFGLSQGTGLSREESGQFIRDYFARYAGAHAYTEGVKETARQTGYVTTLLGRRRPLPELLSTNHPARMAAERVAVNTPVQGTAAEIIKLAMIELHRRLQAEGMRSRMLLQVHDELIFEVPEEEMADLRRLALEIMPAPPGLEEMLAPLVVDLRSGDNWGDLE